MKDKKPVDVNLLDSGNSHNGKLNFVMDPRGRIYAGEPVAAAGELMVVDGMVVSHSRQSGHYKPDEIHHQQFKQEMKERGLDLDSTPEDSIS